MPQVRASPSVLAKLRPILKYATLASIYPCSYTDPHEIKPIRPFIYLAKWSLNISLLFTAVAVCLWNLLRQSEYGFNLDSFALYLKAYLGPQSENSLNAISFVASPVITKMIALLLTVLAPFRAKSICDLEEHFRLKMPRNVQNLDFGLKVTLFLSPFL